MKKVNVILAGIVCLLGAFDASARSKAATRGTAKDSAEAMMAKRSEVEMSEKDFQDEVLSNPQMSGAARASSGRSGGNTAIIKQSGSSNSSSVVQKGDDNVARQTQTGVDNYLRVEQKGRHNRSVEKQTGNHNKKVIIQNDRETIIEQVKP